VPPVCPSSAAAAGVEVVSVAPVKPDGDVSSAAGRAGTPKSLVAQPKSWVPRGARSKSVK
jgi:hypothetical protein